MPTLLQLHSALNYGSIGRIAENIGLMAKNAGWRSVVAHGPRLKNRSELEAIQINSSFDEIIHGGLYSRLLDRHGLGSERATKRFVEIIKNDIKPDIIHLHNIHGYYLNYEVFFKYLQSVDIPIVWTLHDCWPFTGHCVYFDAIGCEKWKHECSDCPQLNTYPAALRYDNSRSNYNLKKRLFSSVSDRLTIVPVSRFLETLVRTSFFNSLYINTIHNGINLKNFAPQSKRTNKDKIKIIGVASPWSERKGMFDFYKLRQLLSMDSFDIELIGLTKKQISALPDGITGIERTQNVTELAIRYSDSTVFVNPTYEDNYPTTNLEAIACGTPVITYNTGGSPESISQETGLVVEKGDINGLVEAIHKISSWDTDNTSIKCREYAINHFDMNTCFKKYFELYISLLNN